MDHGRRPHHELGRRVAAAPHEAIGAALGRVVDRWREAWRGILLASATATATWALSRLLLGHDRPSFAAIAAIVRLSPGLSSRGRQAVGLLAGVATGVAVGVGLRELGAGPLSGIFASASLSMLAAAAFDINPVLIIQAGSSALLVVATESSLGLARLEDAAVGALAALLLSQVLLTPDPVRRVTQASDEVSACVDAASEAQRRGDAEAAVDRAHAAVRAAARLADAVEGAEGIARRTLRGRLRSGDVAKACGAARPLIERAATILASAARARDGEEA